MNIIDTCKKHGFAEAYLLPPVDYSDWTRARDAGAFHAGAAGLAGDLGESYPWANAVLMMVWAYLPLDSGSGKRKVESGKFPPVSPNYFASHRSYLAAGAVMEALAAAGIRAERARIPLRTVAAVCGVGTILKNTMLAIAPYGSRVLLQALMVATGAGQAMVGGRPQVAPTICENCDACARICPAGAIEGDTFHHDRCIRTHMDGRVMEEWVMERMPSLLGCERCQDVCPVNKHLAARALTGAERDAFVLDALLAVNSPLPQPPSSREVARSAGGSPSASPLKEGGLAPALELVGKNQGRRLLPQAIVMAGKSGDAKYIPALRQLARNEDEASASAARWALARLTEEKLRRKILCDP